MHTIFRIIMAVLGLATVYYAVLLASRILPKGRKSQVDLKLNSRKVYDDMRLLLQAFIAFFLGFLIFTIGTYYHNHEIVNIGELFILLFFLGPVTILKRWTKRVIE